MKVGTLTGGLLLIPLGSYYLWNSLQNGSLVKHGYSFSNVATDVSQVIYGLNLAMSTGKKLF